MTYKIEITNDYDELINEIEFDNFTDFIHFFNDTDRKKEYSIKYRGYTLRSFEVDNDYDKTQHELRKYFRIFPDNPNKYQHSLPIADTQNSTTNDKEENSAGYIIGSVILGIFLFPIFLIFGAIKSSK